MKFDIHAAPPSADAIASEHDALAQELQQLKRQDMLASAVLIVVVSVMLSAISYIATESIGYAVLIATLIPLLGSLMAWAGWVSDAGFRSAAHRMIMLNHKVFALQSIDKGNFPAVEQLADKYKQIQAYIDRVAESGRALVNGELSMFWEWDAGTMAKSVRGREYMAMSKKAVDMDVDKQLDTPQFDI